MARPTENAASADGWSDVDLHVILDDPKLLEAVDWSREVSELKFCLRVVRPATGGVRKLTLLFAEGEADLVLLPTRKMRLAKWALRFNLHRRFRVVRNAFENFATIMSGGYRFIKGENDWSVFYAQAVAELPGFRIDNEEATRLANAFLCDTLWVLQKLHRGELIAAQRVMHRSMMETNAMLLHELRIRKGTPTFQQARRVERLVSPLEVQNLKIDARLELAELRIAAGNLFAGLRRLMIELAPQWGVSDIMMELLTEAGLPL